MRANANVTYTQRISPTATGSTKGHLRDTLQFPRRARSPSDATGRERIIHRIPASLGGGGGGAALDVLALYYYVTASAEFARA
jgi:hypothetical protein